MTNQRIKTQEKLMETINSLEENTLAKDYAITIKILTDNDSFGTTCKDTADEVNRILKDLINRIEGECYEVFCNKEDITLHDSSGNKVGSLHYGEVE